eukprot:4614949-Alexandrium_andersonii.AAC.1
MPWEPQPREGPKGAEPTSRCLGEAPHPWTRPTSPRCHPKAGDPNMKQPRPTSIKPRGINKPSGPSLRRLKLPKHRSLAVPRPSATPPRC